MAEYHIWQLSDPPPPPTLHTFLLRHTVNTLLIKFEHNDSDQNDNSAGNMTLQERKKTFAVPLWIYLQVEPHHITTPLLVCSR